MRARAPGKLVLSGSYAVLHGAPAIVAAVDRYVVADTDGAPPLLTAEVAAAITAGAIARAPGFDVGALRLAMPDGSSRKLGIGSSAAILVASLAAAWPVERLGADALRHAIFPVALAAHRLAQGGGSGVDVAASVHGGVLACRLGSAGDLAIAPVRLPDGLVFAVFASPGSASTRQMLAKVRALAVAEPEVHASLIASAGLAAEQTLVATDAPSFTRGLAAQWEALGELGRRAGAPIVSAEVARLHALASAEGAVFVPSGAGGGDVSFYAGPSEPSPGFLAAAERLGLNDATMALGAEGVSVG